MKIDFEITDFPIEEQKKYITAYLEGVLKITINDVVFFDQSGILLIEYAKCVSKWLAKIKLGKIVDFTYETMDNDESILSIIHVKDNFYRIDSIWKTNEVIQLINKNEIIKEFDAFLDNINDVLKIRFNLNLKDL